MILKSLSYLFYVTVVYAAPTDSIRLPSLVNDMIMGFLPVEGLDRLNFFSEYFLNLEERQALHQLYRVSEISVFTDNNIASLHVVLNSSFSNEHHHHLHSLSNRIRSVCISGDNFIKVHELLSHRLKRLELTSEQSIPEIFDIISKRFSTLHDLRIEIPSSISSLRFAKTLLKILKLRKLVIVDQSFGSPCPELIMAIRNLRFLRHFETKTMENFSFGISALSERMSDLEVIKIKDVGNENSASDENLESLISRFSDIVREQGKNLKELVLPGQLFISRIETLSSIIMSCPKSLKILGIRGAKVGLNNGESVNRFLNSVKRLEKLHTLVLRRNFIGYILPQFTLILTQMPSIRVLDLEYCSLYRANSVNGRLEYFLDFILNRIDSFEHVNLGRNRIHSEKLNFLLGQSSELSDKIRIEYSSFAPIHVQSDGVGASRI